MLPLGLHGVERVDGWARESAQGCGVGLEAGWPWTLAVSWGWRAGVALVWLLPTHRVLAKGGAGLCWVFPGVQGLEVCQLLVRASILWGKHPRNPLVTPFPGFLGSGAV